MSLPYDGVVVVTRYHRCSFLDSITEELEEASLDGGPNGDAAAAYEDYKFVTRDELTRLGLAHLIGSPVLKVCLACCVSW